MKNFIFAALATASTLASAVQLACYEDPRTNAHQCVAPSQVYEKDGIRFSFLYTGGPNQITKTSFSVHVNCGTNVFHLKDRDGVSFAGGSGSETKASQSLRNSICSAKISKK